MRNDSCSKIPKGISNSTKNTKDGYPLYRRREDSHFAAVAGIKLDNRWVLPRVGFWTGQWTKPGLNRFKPVKTGQNWTKHKGSYKS